MGNPETKKCPICNSVAETSKEENHLINVDCPTCGSFLYEESIINSYDINKLAPFLYYNGHINKPIKDKRFFNFIGDKNRFDETNTKYPWCYHVTKEIVENWYPKTFNEKIDTFLLGLASRANILGEVILFSEEQLESACFVISNSNGQKQLDSSVSNQIKFFMEHLVNQKYIEAATCKCILLPKGIERIDSLQKNISKTTKNVFIAMSFESEMNKVRDAIKAAIIECGFNPRIMDEIEHNHQIVPEMLYEIRESRFVIAELTNHNNGAYFEAGYALGQNKDVIQICEKSKFGDDGHFDVKQINTILWEDTDDLKKKLIARIKATID